LPPVLEHLQGQACIKSAWTTSFKRDEIGRTGKRKNRFALAAAAAAQFKVKTLLLLHVYMLIVEWKTHAHAKDR